MRKRTIYTLPKGTEPTGAELSSLIKSHASDVAIFNQLESYVDDAPRMSREAPNELLTINNFADYITSVNVGYLLGNPVDYIAKGEQDINPLTDSYIQQSIADIDTDLDEDRSIFGQAFENIYLNERGDICSARLSPQNTIVVYDDTFQHDKMFAVYYSPIAKKIDSYDITVWTATEVITGTLNKDVFAEGTRTPHFAEAVPVIHYLNNRRLKGDFEPVISLIDAYNILQSDRVIDREKLVDALLAFYGSNLTKEDQKAIKDNRVVGLPEGAKAEYIIKNIDEADADVLRQTIAADIHKFSKTPDLTDATFGNAPSGVSILYKLLAFEQNIKKKQRQFEAGLRDRLDIYITLLYKASKLATKLSVQDITITFKRSLPKNDLETSQIINNLTGIVSDETLASQLSFVDDAEAEVEKARENKPALGNFGFNEPEVINEASPAV